MKMKETSLLYSIFYKIRNILDSTFDSSYVWIDLKMCLNIMEKSLTMREILLDIHSLMKSDRKFFFKKYFYHLFIIHSFLSSLMNLHFHFHFNFIFRDVKWYSADLRHFKFMKLCYFWNGLTLNKVAWIYAVNALSASGIHLVDCLEIFLIKSSIDYFNPESLITNLFKLKKPSKKEKFNTQKLNILNLE